MSLRSSTSGRSHCVDAGLFLVLVAVVAVLVVVANGGTGGTGGTTNEPLVNATAQNLTASLGGR